MTTTTGDGLRRELKDSVLELTISRPERMNAVDMSTMRELGAAIREAGCDPSVRSILITGTGPAFCTGADLAAGAVNPADPTVVMDVANEVIRAIVEVPVPVVAAVNGPAAGVGVSIALAADLTYAAESAYFLLAFVGVGLMPDGGSSVLVSASIGRAKAAELALLGERLSAAEADSSGLVSRTLPDGDLLDHARDVAGRLAAGPRRALELTKRALAAATLAALDDALEREKIGQAELLASPDFAEGAAAMLQKRKPRYSG
ncbi:enoyl-CoA hydratase [Prescottella equi]|uniref:Enoyl-CoA hydratase n=1 Tax=Rhodococcus hoagii TaxID=43767 RepID=A0AAE5CDH4_RHOHA|nr:enoyl-CoA hydratase [Prescottella equi]GBF16949.1 1,2-epoxyphenylacetyl-CoA isomerase [Rhodococcus sp. Br-6]AVP66821.1 enoyl-CoA hydratase [Prescottella equi]MBM4468707.1 enoyl-CoA hydratase [Prescottella equi]MBM4478074.1 enoyl-CoA hydratase [Prescottella equi]NKR44621.1 enoyl-CoA hydratase [Prescottella equi]